MWLPLDFTPGSTDISISWKSEWWVDTRTGNTGQSASRLYDEKSFEATLIGNASVVPCSGCSDGNSIGYIGHSGRLRFDGLRANVTSDYSILITYANGDQRPRTLNVNVNGARLARNLTFPTTGNGQSTKELVFQVQFNAGDGNSLEFYNEGAYGPDIDFIRVQCYYTPC